jgi:hypothetical protein
MVLLANEPRSYRQAIAGVLRVLRPDVEVVETEQASLDRELSRGVPELVICSRATPTVKTAPSWIELYTDHGSRSSVSIRQQRSAVEGMEMDELLKIVDSALAEEGVEAELRSIKLQ